MAAGWKEFDDRMSEALAAMREARDALGGAAVVVDRQAQAGNTLEAFRDGQMSELYQQLCYIMQRTRATRKEVRDRYEHLERREKAEATTNVSPT